MQLLRTGRWQGFTALVVFVIVAFGLLSLWQWHRAEDKRDQRIELESALAATPLPLASVALVDGSIVAADEWRHVTVSGSFVPGTQVLVRKRPLDTRNGFWAVAALRAADGTVVWVNRGWLPASGDALSTPDAQAPPTGSVRVTGFLRQFEEAAADANSGLPTGQVAAVSPSTLGDQGAVFPGYVQLENAVPAQTALTPLPLPTVDETRNLSYAGQWLLFAFVAIGGWFFFLRREAKEDAARAGAPPSRQPVSMSEGA